MITSYNNKLRYNGFPISPSSSILKSRKKLSSVISTEDNIPQYTPVDFD